MLSINEITTLFEASPIWSVIGAVFIINIVITVIEMAVDYFSGTPRLWKDTGANIVIFFMGQIIEPEYFR